MPAPLSIGTITLDDGERVHGFLCEAIAVGEAADVTAYGGWRAYLANAGGRHRPSVEMDRRTPQASG